MTTLGTSTFYIGHSRIKIGSLFSISQFSLRDGFKFRSLKLCQFKLGFE